MHSASEVAMAAPGRRFTVAASTATARFSSPRPSLDDASEMCGTEYRP